MIANTAVCSVPGDTASKEPVEHGVCGLLLPENGASMDSMGQNQCRGDGC